jgi:hypothetical protein
MISLSDAIGKGSLRSLTSLRFDDNKISDPCMIAFAEALKSPMGSMGKLDYLSLDGNQIGDEGMVAFSAALSSGSLASLTGLVVNDNEHPQLKAACHQRAGLSVASECAGVEGVRHVLFGFQTNGRVWSGLVGSDRFRSDLTTNNTQ